MMGRDRVCRQRWVRVPKGTACNTCLFSGSHGRVWRPTRKTSSSHRYLRGRTLPSKRAPRYPARLTGTKPMCAADPWQATGPYTIPYHRLQQNMADCVGKFADTSCNNRANPGHDGDSRDAGNPLGAHEERSRSAKGAEAWQQRGAARM